MIFHHVLSEAIAYQRKPLDLNNTLMNFQYLEKLVCQGLVLQSIPQSIIGIWISPSTENPIIQISRFCLMPIILFKRNCITYDSQTGLEPQAIPNTD